MIPYTNITLSSCQEIEQDCSDFPEEKVCGIDASGTEMSEYRNMCELENAVRTSAPAVSSEEYTMLYHQNGECKDHF